MESLQKKSITTSRGFVFTYYVSAPNSTRPTLLLQHGFPDEAHLWAGVVSKLTGYHLIVPDMLGYAGTSKPTDYAAYIDAAHTGDLVEILDAEHVDKVISIGHDFGSYVAQRVYVHHPERVSGLVLLAPGYSIPSDEPPNLPELDEKLEKVFGYPPLAYQEFFVTDEAPALLNGNLDRFYHAMHGAPRDWMKQIWCQRGEMTRWLLDQNRTVELRPYAQNPVHRAAYMERFQRDGFAGPLCYYKAMHSMKQYEVLKALDKDRYIVRVPVCQITCTQDPVCIAELSIPAKTGGFLPDVEEHIIDSGHWVPYENPDKVAELILSFLQRRFSA